MAASLAAVPAEASESVSHTLKKDVSVKKDDGDPDGENVATAEAIVESGTAEADLQTSGPVSAEVFERFC